MFRKLVIKVLIFHNILILYKGYSQTDPQFSQYMFISPYLNPGSVGIDNSTNIAMLIRYQWAGSRPNTGSSELSSSPVSQLFVGSTKIKQINSGIGGYIMRETLGPLSNVNAKVNYAYHFDLGKGKFGVGIGLGIYNQAFNVDVLSPNDPNDPVISYLGSNNPVLFDLNTGLFYQHQNYYIGLSSFHLNEPIYNKAKSDTTKAGTIGRQYYLTGGYNFRINELFTLTPSVIIKTTFPKLITSSIDFSALLKYNQDQFWGGLSYRSGEAIIALVGVGLTKNNALKAGVAFDLTVIGGTAKAGTSYEIMLTYSKPVPDILPKPIIRTPRYRF